MTSSTFAVLGASIVMLNAITGFVRDPGTDVDSWWGPDKQAHCYAGCAVTLGAIVAGISILEAMIIVSCLGVVFEFTEYGPGGKNGDSFGRFSWRDICANTLGVLLAVAWVAVARR